MRALRGFGAALCIAAMPAVTVAADGGQAREATVIVVPAPAKAAPVPALAAGDPAWSPESCRPIYGDKPMEVRARLLAFDTVYGKRAIDWTEGDFDAVVALAKACSGVSIGGGDKFDARQWPLHMTASRNRVLPVALVARAVRERASRIVPDAIRLPSCDELLRFRIDTYAQSDSSADAFGLGFLAMGMPDLERAIGYVNLCLAYLPDYAQVANGTRKEVTRDLVYAIMDRALLIQKRRADWEAQPRYDTDLVLERDGVVVPVTMISPDAREMVSRFNKSSALRRPFSPEAIGQLIRMSEEVLRDNRSGLDRLYAEAVKDRIQREIFRK